LFQCGERKNWTIFTKIRTKLRQKLGYKDQIETEKMTHGIILTCGIITSTSLPQHDDYFTCGNFFLNSKKINK